MRKLLLVMIFIGGCNSQNSPVTNKFHNEASEIFKKYDYSIIFDRTTNSYTALDIEISKEKIKIKDLIEIKNELINNGWEYNYDLDGYYWSFCKKDSNDALGIYYPNERIKKTRNGKDIISNNNQFISIWITNYKSKDLNFEHTECP